MSDVRIVDTTEAHAEGLHRCLDSVYDEIVLMAPVWEPVPRT
ncbi:MAG TPA: hypothetical protein VF483_07865 [Gemmatimonadaceae bacterium]